MLILYTHFCITPSTNRAKVEPFDKTNAGNPHKYRLSAFLSVTQTRFWQLYIMSIKLYIAIFCIIILNILCILYRFGTFCKHFAIIITSNHSSDISLCTPGTHPLKYEMHSYCRLKSAYGLL